MENVIRGRALEKAVSLFQDYILRSDPQFKQGSFSIETNQIRTINGSRLEIDVLVKTLPGSPYEASWIFECKNKAKPAGKNDVVLLADTVNALGATKGFLVAKSFSRDAKARAKGENRIVLLPFSNDFQSALSDLVISLGAHQLVGLKAFLKERGLQSKGKATARNLDALKCVCKWENNTIDFRAFLTQRADNLALADRRANASLYCQEGTHWGEGAEQFVFDPGELLIDGTDFEWLSIHATFFVTAHKLKLISKFEFQDQVRVISFEGSNGAVPGLQVAVSIVEKLPKS